jgi:cytochrome bd-type quinol oxidase subunit 2
MLAIAYNWWKLLHIVGVLGFVMFHGVSAWVALRLRAERNRVRIAELLQFSGSAVRGMYVSLGLLILFGVVAGFAGHYWSSWWIWAAIVILVGMVGEMSAVAGPYYRGVKEAVEVRPSGVPRRSDEELDEILRSPLALFNTVLGFVALVVLAYLMVFKPS